MVIGYNSPMHELYFKIIKIKESPAVENYIKAADQANDTLRQAYLGAVAAQRVLDYSDQLQEPDWNCTPSTFAFTHGLLNLSLVSECGALDKELIVIHTLFCQLTKEEPTRPLIKTHLTPIELSQYLDAHPLLWIFMDNKSVGGHTVGVAKIKPELIAVWNTHYQAPELSSFGFTNYLSFIHPSQLYPLVRLYSTKDRPIIFGFTSTVEQASHIHLT